MIISLGVDCGMAEFCRKHNLRTVAFPFDWTIAYNGVSKCIEDNFAQFLPQNGQTKNIYDIDFFHHFKTHTFQDDIEKYKRRIERFNDVLHSQEKVLFCRKGHATHHHEAHSQIQSDLTDAENLDRILTSRYPRLNYTIIVFIICGKCFDSKMTYTSQSPRIEIHNIAMNPIDDSVFEKCAYDIFKK